MKSKSIAGTEHEQRSGDLRKKLRVAADAVKDAGRSAGQSIASKLDATPAGKKVIAAGETVAGAVKNGAQVIGDAAGKITDNLSGEELHKQIAFFVDQQRRYNDILATRLAEALERIEMLEHWKDGKS